MKNLLEVLKQPTLSTIEIVNSTAIQRVYSLKKPRKNKRLLAIYGVLTFASIVLLFLDFGFGIVAFLLATAVYEKSKNRVNSIPQRGDLLSEIVVETPKKFQAIKEN